MRNAHGMRNEAWGSKRKVVMRGKECCVCQLLLAVGAQVLAVGASARCGEEWYIRQLLVAVGKSAIFVSFFWSRQLNGLGLTASSSTVKIVLKINPCFGRVPFLS